MEQYIFYIVIGGVMVWGIVFIILNVINIFKAKMSTSWASATGRITEARYNIRISSKGGRRLKWHVTYDFELYGQPMNGNTLAFGLAKQINSARIADEIMDKYQVGNEVTVYYQTDNPQNNVIEAGETRYAQNNIIRAGIIVVVLGGFMLYYLDLLPWLS